MFIQLKDEYKNGLFGISKKFKQEQEVDMFINRVHEQMDGESQRLFDLSIGDIYEIDDELWDEIAECGCFFDTKNNKIVYPKEGQTARTNVCRNASLGIEYGSLQECLNNARDDDFIDILINHNITSTITIPRNRITLDLRGHICDGVDAFTNFYIRNKTFVLKSTGEEGRIGRGKASLGYANTADGPHAPINEARCGGAFYLSGRECHMWHYGGRIELNNAEGVFGQGGAIYMFDGAKYTLWGGRINNNIARSTNESVGVGAGGAVYINGNNPCTFTMKSGYINANNGVSMGGAFAVEGPHHTIEVTGGYISENVAHEGGAVILRESGEKFILSGGLVDRNICGWRGQAFSLHEESTLELNGGHVNDNIGGYNGAIYLGSGSSLLMTSGSIDGNKCNLDGDSRGGAIYADEGCKRIIITNNGNTPETSIRNNAARYGGAIEIANLKNTVVRIDHAKINFNEGTEAVGILNVGNASGEENRGNISIEHCNLGGNKGGRIPCFHLVNTTLNINDCTFGTEILNTAIQLTDAGLFDLYNCIVYGNKLNFGSKCVLSLDNMNDFKCLFNLRGNSKVYLDNFTSLENEGLFCRNNLFRINDGSTLELRNSKIENYTSGGAPFHLFSGSNLVIDNCSFKQNVNSVSPFGGLIHNERGSSVTIKNTTLNNCTCRNAALLYTDKSNVVLDNVTVEDCSSVGPSVILGAPQNGINLSIKNCKFLRNGNRPIVMEGTNTDVTIDNLIVDGDIEIQDSKSLNINKIYKGE